MTLQEFLNVTAETDDRDLRLALALALKRGVPRSREGYARFYRWVVDLVESDSLVGLSECSVLPVRATKKGSRRTHAATEAASA